MLLILLLVLASHDHNLGVVAASIAVSRGSGCLVEARLRIGWDCAGFMVSHLGLKTSLPSQAGHVELNRSRLLLDILGLVRNYLAIRTPFKPKPRILQDTKTPTRSFFFLHRLVYARPELLKSQTVRALACNCCPKYSQVGSPQRLGDKSKAARTLEQLN